MGVLFFKLSNIGTIFRLLIEAIRSENRLPAYHSMLNYRVCQMVEAGPK